MTSLFPDIVLTTNKELLHIPHSLLQHWGAAVVAVLTTLGLIRSMSPCPGFGQDRVHFPAVAVRAAEPGAMCVHPGLLFCTVHISTRSCGFGGGKMDTAQKHSHFVHFSKAAKW